MFTKKTILNWAFIQSPQNNKDNDATSTISV